MLQRGTALTPAGPTAYLLWSHWGQRLEPVPRHVCRGAELLDHAEWVRERHHIVTTAPGCRLVGVDKLGTCVTQAQFLCAQDGVPVTVQASVFIDASYDGV